MRKSRPKNFHPIGAQENKVFVHGGPEGADVHDPRGSQKTLCRSENPHTPLSKNSITPPLRTRNFMGILVFQQKEPKKSDAHKIGAAISGPRIAGG